MKWVGLVVLAGVACSGTQTPKTAPLINHEPVVYLAPLGADVVRRAIDRAAICLAYQSRVPMTLIRMAYGYERYHRRQAALTVRSVERRSGSFGGQGLIHEALRQPRCRGDVSTMLYMLYMAKYQHWMRAYGTSRTITKLAIRHDQARIDSERNALVYHKFVQSAHHRRRLAYVSFIHAPIVIGEVSSSGQQLMVTPWRQDVSFLFDQRNAMFAHGLYDAVIDNDTNTKSTPSLKKDALFRYRDCRIYVRSADRALAQLPGDIATIQRTRCPSKAPIYYRKAEVESQ